MVGIDIERINRFENWNDAEFERIFAPEEIKYANTFGNNLEHFCGFYCVKEAMVKALDDDTINFSKIEVLHTETGKPYINKTPYIDAILKEHNRHIIEISISHSKEYSTAIVMVD